MVSNVASSESSASTSTTPEAFQDIPIVDFGGFRDATDTEKLAIGQASDSALQRVGFFFVINHGVPQSQIDDLFDQAARLFALPDAEKLKVSIDNADNHRGYFSVGRENVDPTATVDVKEDFDSGSDATLDGHDDGAMRGANQRPGQSAELRPVMSAYLHQCYDEIRADPKN